MRGSVVSHDQGIETGRIEAGKKVQMEAFAFLMGLTVVIAASMGMEPDRSIEKVRPATTAIESAEGGSAGKLVETNAGENRKGDPDGCVLCDTPPSRDVPPASPPRASKAPQRRMVEARAEWQVVREVRGESLLSPLPPLVSGRIAATGTAGAVRAAMTRNASRTRSSPSTGPPERVCRPRSAVTF